MREDVTVNVIDSFVHADCDNVASPSYARTSHLGLLTHGLPLHRLLLWEIGIGSQIKMCHGGWLQQCTVTEGDCVVPSRW